MVEPGSGEDRVQPAADEAPHHDDLVGPEAVSEPQQPRPDEGEPDHDEAAATATRVTSARLAWTSSARAIRADGTDGLHRSRRDALASGAARQNGDGESTARHRACASSPGSLRRDADQRLAHARAFTGRRDARRPEADREATAVDGRGRGGGCCHTVGRGRSRRRPNVLVVSHCDFTGNSAYHVLSIATELDRLGWSPAIAVPRSPRGVRDLGQPGFQVLSFRDAYRRGPRFPDGDGPDLVHVFTPREPVRNLTLSLVRRYGCPYVVHLEDNELSVQEAVVSGHDPAAVGSFLDGAAGMSVIVDRLLAAEARPRAGRGHMARLRRGHRPARSGARGHSA